MRHIINGLLRQKSGVCFDNATQLTGTTWQYLKVMQKDFEKLHPQEFDELKVSLFDI